jgi:riboflavin synthase
VFTGLIQTLGTCQRRSANTVEITCPAPAQVLADLALGDSVAVDGVCLTVVEILPLGFTAEVSPETLQRSTLGQTVSGMRRVNVETSLRVGSKLGGHFVTGHVDGIGHFQSAQQTATSWEMIFTASDSVARYIVPKGSIAVNGISLTVADCDPAGKWFMVAVIPLTYAETNLSRLQPDGWVNLEGDILGKYVEKFLRSGTPATPSWEMLTGTAQPDRINADFLAEHGYS